METFGSGSRWRLYLWEWQLSKMESKKVLSLRPKYVSRKSALAMERGRMGQKVFFLCVVNGCLC